ncbi:MAG: hypothetical protein ACREMS_01305 [Gemmatimonadaceae bacterium]
MKGGLTLVLLCVCLAPATMLAQQAPLTRSIPVGAHAVIATRKDTKTVAAHVRSDTPGHVMRDIFFGTVAGAAAGVLIGSQTNKGSKEDRELAGLSGGIAGAGIGALLGAAVGVMHKSAHWRAIPPSR